MLFKKKNKEVENNIETEAHPKKVSDKLRQYSDIVIRESGMDEEEVLRRMQQAKQNGIMYKTYARLQYWKYPEEAALEFPFTKKSEQIARRIADAHQKDLVEVEREMLKARVELLMHASTFELFDWDRLDQETKDSFLVPIQTRRMSLEHQREDADEDMLNNKARFYEQFPEFIGRRWFMMDENVSFDGFCEKRKELSSEDLIFKPMDSHRGIGIIKISGQEDDRTVYDRVYPARGLMEECIVQHDDMKSLCPESVNGIRLVCLFWENEFHLIYAVCRMGSGNGLPVDNFSQGGVAAGVDPETGIFNTYAVNKAGDVFEAHPATGVTIRGFQVPFWDETVRLARNCSERLWTEAGMGYVGWDIAITPQGPVVIEGNGRPGVNMIQQCTYTTYGKGAGYLFKDYLR